MAHFGMKSHAKVNRANRCSHPAYEGMNCSAFGLAKETLPCPEIAYIQPFRRPIPDMRRAGRFPWPQGGQPGVIVILVE
jgi:hypothetical protein